MRYTNEFREQCVDLYRRGEWMQTPVGVKQNNFRKMIRRWARIEDNQGKEAFKHKKVNKTWSTEEKLKLVAYVIAGKSILSTAMEAGIHHGILYQWVAKYKKEGYNGLVQRKKGRPCKGITMKKEIDQKPLSESEREELIKLRAEIEYIKAENEVIKKRIALRREKEDVRLKAKKQKSSKNSSKKDIL